MRQNFYVRQGQDRRIGQLPGTAGAERLLLQAGQRPFRETQEERMMVPPLIYTTLKY